MNNDYMLKILESDLRFLIQLGLQHEDDDNGQVSEEEAIRVNKLCQARGIKQPYELHYFDHDQPILNDCPLSNGYKKGGLSCINLVWTDEDYV